MTPAGVLYVEVGGAGLPGTFGASALGEDGADAAPVSGGLPGFGGAGERRQAPARRSLELGQLLLQLEHAGEEVAVTLDSLEDVGGFEDE